MRLSPGRDAGASLRVLTTHCGILSSAPAGSRFPDQETRSTAGAVSLCAAGLQHEREPACARRGVACG